MEGYHRHAVFRDHLFSEATSGMYYVQWVTVGLDVAILTFDNRGYPTNSGFACDLQVVKYGMAFWPWNMTLMACYDKRPHDET